MRGLIERFGRLLIRLLFRLQIEGLERFPLQGPVIMMVNHINFTDVSVLSVVMPREPVGLAKQELADHWLLGPIVRLYGVIPIKRGMVDRAALRRAEALLREAKHVLMIAPEGHRSGSGQLQWAHDGVALLAVRTGATVAPVAVTGVENFWRNVLRLRKTDMRVTVGRPFRFVSTQTKPDRETLRAMTTEAMYQLAALCPPEYRGVYADLSRLTTQHLDFNV
jgi:1-acyl-sn-glycerol-3-phosphate acyltransferase